MMVKVSTDYINVGSRIDKALKQDSDGILLFMVLTICYGAKGITNWVNNCITKAKRIFICPSKDTTSETAAVVGITPSLRWEPDSS